MKNHAQLINAIASYDKWPRWCWRCGLVFTGMVLGFDLIALAPQARGACEEGCDISNNNTFLGGFSLVNNTTGTVYQAWESNTTGSNNTAHGPDALNTNTSGSYNTANGALALFSSTTGTQNPATGYQALYNDTTGGNNTANGVDALFSNTIG